MSMGYNPNNWFDLIAALVIGIALFIFGLWAMIDRFFFGFSSFFGFDFSDSPIDLGKYHRIIGLGSIALSVVYLYLVIKNYSKEA